MLLESLSYQLFKDVVYPRLRVVGAGIVPRPEQAGALRTARASNFDVDPVTEIAAHR